MPRSYCSIDWIVDEVRREHNMSHEAVRPIIDTVFKSIAKQLHKRIDVILLSFGTFKVREDEYGVPKVKFAASPSFMKNLSVRPEMNKYSVVLDRNKTALAKLSGKCPDCGTDLESLDPPKCPTHGTAPFEGNEPSEAKDE